jgi:hypothetical protein
MNGTVTELTTNESFENIFRSKDEISFSSVSHSLAVSAEINP